MTKNKNLYHLVLTAILSALIVVMTVVPYTGYIPYGVVTEITTLHIVTIVGAVFLGWKGGAVLGGVWGLTCIFRAMTNPQWAAFMNPLVSLVPRVLVGVVAALVFDGLCKIRVNRFLSSIIAAIAATNTLLVVSALALFGDRINGFFELMKNVYLTVITINGLIELAAAAILTPVLTFALSKVHRD